MAAGIVEVPEASPHTSVTTRVEHVKTQSRIGDLKAAERGSVAGSDASAGLEEAIWLCPVEDRRKLDSSRDVMLEGLSLCSELSDVSRCPINLSLNLNRNHNLSLSLGFSRTPLASDP